MLHKATYIIGFHLLASDGSIGHVDDLLIDEQTLTLRYLVVDTSNWIGGRHVLVAANAITAMDPVERTITVTVTRDHIKQAPSVNTVDIPLAETAPAIWIM